MIYISSFLIPKCGFFSESSIHFLDLQKLSQKTILSLKFKFHAQDSFLEYLYLDIWRFEKQIALSEQKLPLATRCKDADQHHVG